MAEKTLNSREMMLNNVQRIMDQIQAAETDATVGSSPPPPPFPRMRVGQGSMSNFVPLDSWPSLHVTMSHARLTGSN